MADEQSKIEIGFGIGQVLSVRLSEKELGALRKAVEAGSGWHDLKTQEGTISLNLATVVFIKHGDAAHTIGFSH